MRRHITVVFLAILLAFLGYLVLVRGMKAGKAPSPLESRYNTEEQWLVDAVVRDIVETAVFAAGKDAKRAVRVDVEVGAPEPAGGLPVRIRLPAAADMTQSLALRSCVFCPEDYVPLATAVIGALGVRAEAAPDQPDEALLGRLMELRGPVLAGEDTIISTDLEARPGDPRLHEEAALLLGAFGLREAAESFADSRPALCRMASHLALARAFRGTEAPGLAGRYARVLLLALAGREAEAETALSSLEGEGKGRPTLLAWNRALRLRITRDWRVLPSTEGATLLESLEYSRAAQDALYLPSLDSQTFPPEAEDVPDFGFLALQNPSVAAGNRFAWTTLDRTLTEAGRVFALVHGRELPDAELVAALNQPALRLVTPQGPRVLGWGTWAAFYQRHVCFLARMNDHHLRNMMSMKDAAEAAGREADARFSALDLYTLVAARRDVDTERPRKRLDEAIVLVIRRPEIITASNWWGFSWAVHDEVTRHGLPDLQSWFSTGCPRGTTLDFFNRGPGVPITAFSVAAVEALRTLAPRDIRILRTLIERRYGKEPAPQDVAREMGPLLDYHLWAIGQWAAAAYGKKDDVVLRQAGERRCALNAETCLGLGYDLVTMGEDEAAVKAYERAIAASQDRVAVSNNCGWLMLHYVGSGRRQRALEVAEMAAGVGSASGLLTMASYLEETGDYKGAEEYIGYKSERYGSDNHPNFAIGMYHRLAHVRQFGAYEEKFKEAARRVFPGGLQPLDPESLKGAPTRGVRILKVGPQLRRMGLRGGETVVAVDGYRVETEEQLWASRELSKTPELTLLVWQVPKYVEVRTRTPNRAIDVEEARGLGAGR